MAQEGPGTPVPPTAPPVETPQDSPLSVPPPTVPDISVDGDDPDALSQSVSLIVIMALGSTIPALMVLMTSFTRFIIVLSLTRNAIGVQNTPPAPVLIGLSLFLTLFVMKPVLMTVNADAIQPMLNGEIAPKRRSRPPTSRCEPSCWLKRAILTCACS